MRSMGVRRLSITFLLAAACLGLTVSQMGQGCGSVGSSSGTSSSGSSSSGSSSGSDYAYSNTLTIQNYSGSMILVQLSASGGLFDSTEAFIDTGASKSFTLQTNSYPASVSVGIDDIAMNGQSITFGYNGESKTITHN